MASPENRTMLSNGTKLVIAAHTPLYLPLVHRCMECIIPKFSNARIAEKAAKQNASQSPSSDSVSGEEVLIKPSFFVEGTVPSISEYGPEQMYLTINSAELCSALFFFDDRR